MSEESAAMQQYRQAVSALEERFRCGEMTMAELLDSAISEIAAVTPGLSAEELASMSALITDLHTALCKAAAVKGSPIPGNDPARPN